MRNLFLLIKVQFLSLFKTKKKIDNGIKGFFSGVGGKTVLALLLGGLICGYAYFYADMFASVLALQGQIGELVAVMLSISVIVSLMFSFYSSINALYGYKDYELLSSMPIKTRHIVISKIAFSYIADLILAILIVVPSLVVYANYQTITVELVLRILVLVIFSPFFAICVSLFLGAIISLLSARFIRKSLVQTILMFAVIVGVLLIYFGQDVSVDSMASIRKYYPLYSWLVNGLNDWLYVGLFALVSLAGIVAFVLVVSITYKKMNDLLSARKTKRNFKLKGEYKTRSVFTCLYIKETKTLFSYPMYAINSLMGAVMSIAIAIFVALALSAFNLPELVSLLVFAPAVFAFTALVSPTSASSISLEAQPFWIIKSSPVPVKTLFNAKLAVNATYALPSAFISAIAISIGLKASLIASVLVTLCAVLFATLGGFLGLIYNLLLPVMKWENVSRVVKQSGAVALCVLSSFALAGGMFALGYFIDIKLELVLLIAVLIVLVLNVFAYFILNKKGEALLKKNT